MMRILKFMAVAALFAAAIFFSYYYFLRGSDEENKLLPTREAHFYNDPATSIAKIRVKIFYAVPADKIEFIADDWRDPIVSAMDKIAQFHNLQLRGLSELSYDLFPEPVFLEREEEFYNSASTDFGNPRGLVSVAEEIEKRVFNSGGDLYSRQFAEFAEGEYRIMGLIYEGVGASGGVIYDTGDDATREEIAERLGVPESMVYLADISSVKGFFLLNNSFLRESPQSLFGPTLMYHELAHAYGLPDRDVGDVAQSNDIMGGGRYEPLEVVYIDTDLLSGLGIFSP